jgi:hypothetical protein
MKLAASLLTASLALMWSADAFAASRKYRDRDYSRSYESPRTRSNTTAYNGTCQRDTGTHNSSLNFRNRCDMEEFWARQNGRGGGRR